MSKIKNPVATDEQARRVIQNLEKNFYGPLDIICQRLMDLGMSLKETDEQQHFSVYSSLLLGFVTQVQHICHDRRSVTLPYLTEIAGKAQSGHNCLNCADDCDTEHNTHVSRIENDHYGVRDIFGRLQKIAPPLFSEEGSNESYRLIRKELAKMNSLVFELLYLEESQLIPVILDTQRKINATDR